MYEYLLILRHTGHLNMFIIPMYDIFEVTTYDWKPNNIPEYGTLLSLRSS